MCDFQNHSNGRIFIIAAAGSLQAYKPYYTVPQVQQNSRSRKGYWST